MANLEDLQQFVYLLAIVSILGATVAISLSDFKANVPITTTFAPNESKTVTVGTNFQMINPELTSINWVRNGSGVQLATTEFKLFNAGATNYAINISNSSRSSGTFYLNYSYKVQDYVQNITSNGLQGVYSSTQYLDTSGTLIGVAVLIGIVVLAFAFARR